MKKVNKWDAAFSPELPGKTNNAISSIILVPLGTSCDTGSHFTSYASNLVKL